MTFRVFKWLMVCKLRIMDGNAYQFFSYSYLYKIPKFSFHFFLNHPFLWYALQWRHNGSDGVSNHQPHDCLLDRLFRCRSKKTLKQWRGALMFSLVCAWTNAGANSRGRWWFETPSRSSWRHCNGLMLPHCKLPTWHLWPTCISREFADSLIGSANVTYNTEDCTIELNP